jgi:DNA helicase HerA-like ATPase
MLLHDREYKGQVSPADITSVMLRMGPDANREAFLFASAHNIPQWRALAIILFKAARHGRRRAVGSA